MKRLSLGVAAAAILLAAVPGAGAKAPPSGLDVCGATACVHLDGAQAEPFWFGANLSGARLPAPSSFYVLRWRWQAAGPEWTAYYIPAAGVVRWRKETQIPSWTSISGSAIAALARASDQLEPYAVPAPTMVTVGQKTARGAETYLRLFEGPGAGIPPAIPWVPVTVRSETPSPWTDAQVDLAISARGLSRFVWVDGWVHKVPWRVANRARHGLPLSP